MIYFFRVLLPQKESVGGLRTTENTWRSKYTTFRILRCVLNEIPVWTSGKFRAQVCVTFLRVWFPFWESLPLRESAGGQRLSKNRRRTKYTILRKLRCILNEIPVWTSGKFRAQVWVTVLRVWSTISEYHYLQRSLLEAKVYLRIGGEPNIPLL